jgi:hypothetical protein
MTGVVLIDEIDAHLHPRWQMQVVTTLRTLFPRMTFVATTHNPLALVGARDGEGRVDDAHFGVGGDFDASDELSYAPDDLENLGVGLERAEDTKSRLERSGRGVGAF